MFVIVSFDSRCNEYGLNKDIGIHLFVFDYISILLLYLNLCSFFLFEIQQIMSIYIIENFFLLELTTIIIM